MKKYSKHTLCLVLMLMMVSRAISQRICHETKQHITLSNGVSVDIFKERGSENYYYVSKQVQISTKSGKREFSFQEYKKNEGASASGAILHCLFTWGLTKEQLKELRLRIKQKYGEQSLVSGAIGMEPISQNIEFSNTKIGNVLKNALQSRGSLPTLSNSKIALSFHIKQNDVATIREALKQPLKFNKTTLTLHYKYQSYTCNSTISSMKDNEIKVTGELQNWF